MASGQPKTIKPIPFSAPMIRALIDGRKTQTRRVLKPEGIAKKRGFSHLQLDVLDGQIWWWNGEHDRVGASQAFPYAPGDLLWVREAWRTPTSMNGNAAQLQRDCAEAGCTRTWAPIQYEADNRRVNWEWSDFVPGRYRHARFMPRWASRITLRVTDVRVERVQDITLGDICAEGLAGSIYDFRPVQHGFKAWEEYWNSLHGLDAWARNDWVWAISFQPVIGNVDQTKVTA